MKQFVIGGLRIFALWIALIAAAMIGSMLVTLPPRQGVADGPLPDLGALLIASAVAAFVLSALAARLSGKLATRALILFLILFFVETALSLVEAVFFGPFVALPASHLVALAAFSAIRSALAACAAVLLWPPAAATHPQGPVAYWKFAVGVLLYVMLYFGAGEYIAWQSEAVRTYYDDGATIDQGRLIILQVARGAIWIGLAYLLFRRLEASVAVKSLVAGLAFALLMATPLLYPNEFMPWSVRQVHMIELLVSNFLFGVLAIVLFAASLAKPGAGQLTRPDPVQ
jgi:hypothetical protein